jgi:hypothetical protein
MAIGVAVWLLFGGNNPDAPLVGYWSFYGMSSVLLPIVLLFAVSAHELSHFAVLSLFKRQTAFVFLMGDPNRDYVGVGSLGGVPLRIGIGFGGWTEPVLQHDPSKAVVRFVAAAGLIGEFIVGTLAALFLGVKWTVFLHPIPLQMPLAHSIGVLTLVFVGGHIAAEATLGLFKKGSDVRVFLKGSY